MIEMAFLQKIGLIFLLMIGCFINGQTPFANVLNKNHGLQSNSIYDIYQDKKGYIWLATGKGLCRYNGSDFVHFKSVKQTMKSGSCIKEDKYGRIWYSNFDGFLYYVEGENLLAFPQKTNVGFLNFGITENHIYLPLNQTIQVYDLNSFELLNTINVESKILNALQVKDEFYVFTKKLYQLSNQKIKTVFEFPISNDNDFIAPIMVSQKDKLYIVSKFSKKIFVFHNNQFEEKPFDLNINFIQNVSQSTNYLWLNTPSGTYRFKDDSSNYQLFFNEVNISCVFQDKDESYWIGTQNSGLYFVPNFNTTIEKDIKKPTKLLSHASTRYTGNACDEVYQNKQLLFKSNENHVINLIHHDTINQQLIWASSKLYKYDLKQKKIKSEVIMAIKDLIQFDDNYYAYAASGSCGLLPAVEGYRDKSNWIQPQKDKSDKKIVLKDGLNGKTVAKTQNGQLLYFGTNQGLFVFEKNNEKEILDKGKKVYISQLKAYQNDVYALGTNDLLYQIKADKISKWTKGNELTNNNTQKIFLSQPYLYIYNGTELFEYNLKNNVSNKIFHSSAFEILDVMLEKQKVVLATNEGIITLSNSGDIEKYRPFLKIKYLEVDDEKIINIKKEVKIKSNPKIINIPFEYINFKPFGNNQILYKINNGKWLAIPATLNLLQLASLAPNNYTIQLKVENYENTKTTIKFFIQKPWYLRWWFFVLATIGLTFLIYSLLKWQKKRINAHNQAILEKIELEKNLNQSTIKAIKSQMNPHFFFNALNTIQSFILSNDKKQAINYLSKFSVLTRNILDMSEKDSVSIQDEIKTLTTYLEIEQARFHEDFSFNIQTINLNDLDTIKIPTMIIQPYVENAIKHGLLHKQGLKTLDIIFENTNDFVEVKIEDNGVGRQKSGELNAIKNKHHQSFATKAIQNRIDLINKNNDRKIDIAFKDKSNGVGQSLGTIVTIHFPLNLF